ncbi:hypothetical protein [Reichenbachiella ulvae]|uniref:Uncharacterized protein n=1 Tax=Reichenbachiella ulvae TaxID=2980104 RepID=A0ABT3CQY5_9BACT|nr:hypothetical protein [Reichenbachiella ulvae]MCV9385973.1 hypothetical protein [Reichenbachiella ulvae]
MKKLGLIITLILPIVMMAGTSCQNSSSKKLKDAKTEVVEAQDNLSKAEKEYRADMEKYKKESQSKISANEKSIREFKERIANDKKEAKAEYNQKISDLEQKNADLKRKLDEYKLEGKEKWDAFKVEFNRDMDNLGNALMDLTKDNKK